MKKAFFLPTLALLGCILIDVVTKRLALAQGVYWVNNGLMLGFLSDLPTYLLVLSLSAICGVLFLVYVSLQMYLHPRLFGLKMGIAVLTAGITGNVIDKAMRGWTLDWIPVPWGTDEQVAFNLADVFIWAGLITIVWWLFRREEDIWFPGNQRRQIWHHPREQVAFGMKFVALVGGLCMMLGFFSYAFIRQIMAPLPPELAGDFARQYLVVLACLSTLFMTVAFIIGIWISHRIQGPVVALRLHVQAMMEGQQKEFRLRDGDMLKHLEEVARLVGKLMLALLLPTTALAYPHYIGLQYTSCLTCHYNPQGNGPLNDYGRGVGATAIAGRMGAGDASEEDLVAASAFPGINPQKNKWLRPFIGYRNLMYDNGAFSSDSQKRLIHMQLDANLTLKAGARDQYIMAFTLGTRPTEAAIASRDLNNLMESKSFSREHYLGWRPTPKVGLYAGKMDKAYGVRIPDHNLSSRRSPGVAQFDQVHGLMVHGVGEKLEGSVHYFVGDLNEKDEDLRDKGYSGILEWGVTERSRLGFSYQNSKTESLARTSMAVHDRIGFGKGHAVIMELGQVTNDPTQENAESYTSRYALLQTHIMWFRGMWVQTTLDYFRRDTKVEEESFGVGPGLQWFPRQKVELRLDVINRRAFSETTANKDTWQLLGQVHLWL
jgi:lipoprotein signal peptidase